MKMQPFHVLKKAYDDVIIQLHNIHRATGRPMVLLLGSYISCRLLHGAGRGNFSILHMYEMNNYKRGQVFTSGRMIKISDELNRNASKEDLDKIISKVKFNQVYSKYIHREWLYVPSCTKDTFLDFVRRNPKFLVKTIVSTQGKGVQLFENAGEEDALWEQIRGENAVIEAFIHQHEEIAKINPTSVNTIRIITACRNGQVHILGSFIRCGGKDSFVDNFHSGGCGYPIDTETGIVSGYGRAEMPEEEYLRHPSTGVVMLGFQIPYWDAIKEMVCSAARESKNVGYIGWDVAVLENGCELIEGNVNYPGANLLNLCSPNIYREMRAFMDKTK